MVALEERQEQYQSSLITSWNDAIRDTFGASPPASRSWLDVDDCVNALAGFMTSNYSFLPPNGHLQLFGVRRGDAFGQLVFDLSEDGECEVSPSRVHFEYIEGSPQNSFFLIDLRSVPPTGIYEEVRETEQVIKIDGQYADYALWDRGFWYHDDDGMEVPLPEGTKLVYRLLSGKLLIVCKASLWNHDSSTWDGRHNHMTPAAIRNAIEKTIADGSDIIFRG